MKHNRIVDPAQQDEQQLKTLRDQRNQLKLTLTKYGRHMRDCPATRQRRSVRVRLDETANGSASTTLINRGTPRLNPPRLLRSGPWR
jgi:hypothetical protein